MAESPPGQGSGGNRPRSRSKKVKLDDELEDDACEIRMINLPDNCEIKNLVNISSGERSSGKNKLNDFSQASQVASAQITQLTDKNKNLEE